MGQEDFVTQGAGQGRGRRCQSVLGLSPLSSPGKQKEQSSSDAAEQHVLGSLGLGSGMSGSPRNYALTAERSLSKLLLPSIPRLLPGEHELCRAAVAPTQQWPLDVTVIQLMRLVSQMASVQAGSIFKAVEQNLSIFHPFLKGSINLMGLQMVFSCDCPQYH